MDLSTAGTVVATVLVAVVCFAIGGLNPATAVGRSRGVDVATVGSGNPGATNLGRVLGRRWGIAVGVLDVLKGLVPTLVVNLTLGTWLALLAGAACVVGHVYSPYLAGRGGKGVATSLGAMLAVVPWVALVGLAAFLLALPFVRRLGNASVVATAVLVNIGVGHTVRADTAVERGVGVWLTLLSLLVLARHRRNILVWVTRLSS